MSIFNEFPQTNFHELNLDWVIAKVKELADDWASSTENWETLYTNSNNLLEQSQNLIADFQEYVTNYFENLDLSDEVREEINRLNNNGTMAGIVAVALSGTVTTWLQNNITLPEGVVIDSGLTVQGAAADAKATGDRLTNLENYNFKDLLLYDITKSDTTHNGVTYVWSGNSCHLSGTASPTSFNNIVSSINSIPAQFQNLIGKKVLVYYDNNSDSLTNTYLNFYFYKNGEILSTLYVRGYQEIEFPADATGLIIRLYVASGLTVNETVNFFMSENNVTTLINGFIKPLRFVTTLGAVSVDSLSENTFYMTSGITLNTPITDSGYIFTFGNGVGFKSQFWVSAANGRFYYRYKTANSDYTAWINQANFIRDAINAMCFYGPAPNDLNDCVMQSVAVDTGNSDNSPATGSAGYVITLGTTTASAIQFWINYGNGEIYYRRGLAGVWYDWIKNASGSEGGNPNSSMFSIGNSILSGSVWKNGSYDHLAPYYNTPYGCIANAIGISANNETHRLISDTGLLYDAGNGSFLDSLETTDLSKYDVVLTHLWLGDINQFALGDINSPAGKTTIAGAVKYLYNLVNGSNKNTQLILVGVPPCDVNITGNNAFTGDFLQGYSIGDCDNLLQSMAVAMHFTYISFADLNMSYYWQDLTDGNNVHFNNENSYRAIGGYLGAKASQNINY